MSSPSWKHPSLKQLIWIIALMLLFVWTGLAFQAQSHNAHTAHHIVLLIPDHNVLQHPITRAWLLASEEEGLEVRTMTADEFIRNQANHTPTAGVLLPDTVHRHASDLLVNTLTHYVETGGQLLVSFDAALLNLQYGTYAENASRLSHLVGMRYAMYEQLQSHAVNTGPIYADRRAQTELNIQPGKLDFQNSAQPDWGELTTYAYPHLLYSHFTTEALDPFQTWFRSAEGDPVVSTHAYGKGQVLFANLPLGYLKTRTDGYLLHRLLGYFASHMVGMPQLSSTPQGLGGIVLNLHVDSNASQQPLANMEAATWFDDGPYSIHVTAGPDALHAGDGLGLNLPNNPWMQAFLKRQQVKGHEIGNHGGWSHNIYGYQANESNASTFERYLRLNHASVSTTIGQLAKAYSAPMGNQPAWATDWLDKNGFKGYYATSDTGLGPTRSFIQGQPPAHSGLWAFPISNFHRIATLDEVQEKGMQEDDIRQFIHELIEHVSEHHVVRLFYFHPAAAPYFQKTLTAMQAQTRQLQAEQRFRWYSMADMADFMNRRLNVHWGIVDLPGKNHQELTARSDTSLQAMTWVFPAHTVDDLQITQGLGELRQDKGQWLLVAGDCTSLQVQWRSVR